MDKNNSAAESSHPSLQLGEHAQGFDTALLLAIINGQADAVAVAKRELASRGLDANGKWIGFAKAHAFFGIEM